jgi:hypothetical protein
MKYIRDSCGARHLFAIFQPLQIQPDLHAGFEFQAFDRAGL